MKRKRKNKKQDVPKKKIVYGILAIFIVIAGTFLYLKLSPINEIESNLTFQYRAAIVDHLSSSLPNQTFVEKAAKKFAEKTGSTVFTIHGKTY